MSPLGDPVARERTDLAARAVLVKPQTDLPVECYAAITHAIFGVLDAAGLADCSSIVNDRSVSDAEPNAAFDWRSEDYPCSPI